MTTNTVRRRPTAEVTPQGGQGKRHDLTTSTPTSPIQKITAPINRWTSQAGKVLLGLALLAFILRSALIDSPAEVVFDEVHFGGFASNYLRREYFFDVHPPFGKLLIAGISMLFGYDGGFTFASIGDSYAATSAPYIGLRLVMVLFSVASVALSYASLIEMGFSVIAASLAGLLMVFDNALTVQSRFILLDAPMMFFISAAVYCWIKFRQQRYRPFETQWFTWLVSLGMAIGAATSIKMVGLFTVALIGIATISELWELIDYKRHLSDRTVFKHFAWRAVCLIAIPVTIYLASYWVHFAVLTRTGPGDRFMSSTFQQTLEGNQMHEKSRDVYYGHTIRLKSRLEEIFLHSHLHNYPRQHDDGKISSEGQQVTGYPARDANNLWKILPAEGVEISHKKRIPVKSGDGIKFLHMGTNKVLFTHDVASPLTKTNMEITVADPENKEKSESSVWVVDIKHGGSNLKSHSCQFRLFHKTTQSYLINWQQPLPKWGFQQREVNGDRRGADENAKWIVWDIEEPMEDFEMQAKLTKPKTVLSFWQKFVELQRAQVKHNANLIDNHPFKSDPISWPFVIRGVSYWDKNRMARIYLLGNPVAWYTALFGLAVYFGVALRELYLSRRGRRSFSEDDTFERRFLYRSGFILLAWAMHYFPFFTMARTLYLHHYLPAYVMSTMVTGIVFDYAMHRMKNKTLGYVIWGIIATVTVATFFYFATITYGTQIPTSSLASKKWAETWDWP